MHIVINTLSVIDLELYCDLHQLANSYLGKSKLSHLCVTFHAEKLVNWGRERERKSVSWLGKLLFSFHRKRFFFLLFKMWNLFEGTIRTKKIRLNLATINISFINYMSRFAIPSFLLKQKLLFYSNLFFCFVLFDNHTT